METGKVFSPIRTLLGLSQSKSTKDREPQQGGHGHPRRFPNRRPTKEEVEKVHRWLSTQESVQKNGLSVVPEEKSGVFTLLILDASGKSLKTLLGDEIFRLLEAAEEESEQSSRGSILDRRI